MSTKLKTGNVDRGKSMGKKTCSLKNSRGGRALDGAICHQPVHFLGTHRFWTWAEIQTWCTDRGVLWGKKKPAKLRLCMARVITWNVQDPKCTTGFVLLNLRPFAEGWGKGVKKADGHLWYPTQLIRFSIPEWAVNSWRHQVSAELGCTGKTDPPKFTSQSKFSVSALGGRRKAADRGCGALGAVHRLTPVLQPPTPFQVAWLPHTQVPLCRGALDDIHMCRSLWRNDRWTYGRNRHRGLESKLMVGWGKGKR